MERPILGTPVGKSEISGLINRLRTGKIVGPAVDKDISDTLRVRPAPYSTSLDAARTLVPRPRGSMSLATIFEVGGFQDDRSHGGRAKVWHDTGMAGAPYDRPPYEATDCASPAVALCIAGLEAFVGEGGYLPAQR